MKMMSNQVCSSIHNDMANRFSKVCHRHTCMYTQACTCVHTHVLMHVRIHTYTCTYTCACTYTGLYTYTHVYTYTHMCTCTHTYVYTHTHILHCNTFQKSKNIHEDFAPCLPKLGLLQLDSYNSKNSKILPSWNL